LAKREAEEVKE